MTDEIEAFKRQAEIWPVRRGGLCAKGTIKNVLAYVPQPSASGLRVKGTTANMLPVLPGRDCPGTRMGMTGWSVSDLTARPAPPAAAFLFRRPARESSNPDGQYQEMSAFSA
jgi:hypothetical protein